MRRLIFSQILALALFTGCTHRSVSPVSLKWQHLGNDVENGVCKSRFTMYNNSGDTLFADWKIYFNQMSITPLVDDTAPLEVVQLHASYHCLCPTAFYQPLAPYDSVSTVIRYRGSIMRKSMAPQGPFFVFKANSVDYNAKPLNVDIEYIYSADGSEFRRKVPVFPYADGEYMYSYNERIDIGPFSSPMEIFPYPKYIQYIDDVSTIKDDAVLCNGDNSIPPEGYRLEIMPDGITITSCDDAGLYYGQLTLNHLREVYGNELPCCSIEDFPDMQHRGLMLDIARNFTPKDEILRLIDLLSLYKMNVLHLHLTDDEGWRLEIPGLPELTEVGARRGYTTDEHDCLIPLYTGGYDANDLRSSANGYLTRNDFIEILRYAESHHVRVVPEVDMPGHSRAAIKAMEARYYKYITADSLLATEYLLSDFADTSHYVSAQHYTDNVMCIALPSCFNFVRKVIDEIVAMYAEAQAPLEIFHVGGDEVPRGAWLGSPVVAQYVAAHRAMEVEQSLNINSSTAVAAQAVSAHDVANLKDSFLESLIAILDGYGLQIAGWEEIAFRGGHPNPRFAARNALTYCWNSVPEWRGDEKPYTLANAGYPVMICSVTNLYLDMCNLNHEDEQGLNWGGYVDEYQAFLCRPNDVYRSVERTLQGKPRDLEKYAQSAKVRLIPDSAHNIRGMQAQLWSETIRNSKQLERYLFPRLLGVAQRAWNNDFRIEEKEYELSVYNNIIWQQELPRLHRKGIAFHVVQPGIHRCIGETADTVIMNSVIANAEIRYTLDGSEPNAGSTLYKYPFVTDAPLINAAVFYLGEKSNTTHSVRK